jgi:eukaryotic-like serine/threonine-protein kinase
MTGRSQFPRKAQSLPQGTQLNNMFEIDELVTAGGMGEVYRGHNIQTKDPVAIKVVLPEFAQDEFILELFRKEARILNHLHHEAIVRYYVFSIDAALGLPFLVMEFVDGPSLAERIKEGPLDTASIATLQQHLADGLEKAHQAGVIHRDIAPDNIILPDGRVDRAKIIDFGIARSAAAGGTLLGGQFAGKYNFVSPEQLGLFDGDVTNRSDIYSLGLVLAACALGKPLDMSGSQVAVIEKRRTVPDLTGIDPPLRGLIEAMLQPDPQERPQSMAEVADWPTYEPPEADIEKTRVYTTPPRAGARRPSRRPSSHPSSPPSTPPAEALQESAPPPATPPAPPPAETAQESSPPSPPAESVQESPPPPSSPAPAQRAKPVERRHEKPKSKIRLIASAIALVAILLAGVGGWAYVEFWSGDWYQDQARVEPEVAVPEPTPQDDEIVAEPEPPAEDDEIIAEPAPPGPRFTAADVRDYVAGYDGGSCFFAFPADVGDSHAAIIGYGNQRAPFDALRNSFQQRFGFEAAIELRSVADDQCVVVEALGRLTTEGTRQVAIDLSHGVVRSGRSLSGTISGLGERQLALVMLDNFGFLHNLSGYVTREGGSASFEIQEMSTANPMDFQPQLILSVASAEPLQSLALAQSVPARELLPSLLEEIAGKPEGLATAVGYFMFGS